MGESVTQNGSPFSEGRLEARMSGMVQIAEQWRTSAGTDNPAGPLFAYGAFTESDIVEAHNLALLYSISSGSQGVSCC
jgi:hypothetical protein